MIIPSFDMWKAIKEYHRWKVDLRSGIKISEILQQTVRMSEKLCLQWNDFKENVNSAFGRLRDDKEFTDVTLACDDGQMEAHKVILAASSPSTSTDLLERVNIQLCYQRARRSIKPKRSQQDPKSIYKTNSSQFCQWWNSSKSSYCSRSYNRINYYKPIQLWLGSIGCED